MPHSFTIASGISAHSRKPLCDKRLRVQIVSMYLSHESGRMDGRKRLGVRRLRSFHALKGAKMDRLIYSVYRDKRTTPGEPEVWRWSLRSDAAGILARSREEGYGKKEDCVAAITLVSASGGAICTLEP